MTQADDTDARAHDDEIAGDIASLLRYAVLLALAGVVLAVGGALAGLPGAPPFAKGLALGSAVSVLNLRVLARAAFALLREQDATFALLGFGASFALLLGTATWVALAQEAWILGFAVGLALPAPAGVWFGLRIAARKRD